MAGSDSQRGLRVLMVAPQPFFEARGTPINVLRMVRALCHAGHRVHLVTYPLGTGVTIERLVHVRSAGWPGIRRVPIGFSKRKVLLDALMAIRVGALLFTRRFDVVHAIEESVFFVLPLALLRGVPVIYDLDSSISEQLEYSGTIRGRFLLQGVRALESAALRRSALAITVCGALTDTVRSLHPRARIAQIEDCALEEALRVPDAEAVARLRAQHGLVGARVLVYTGNLEPYQGIDRLLGALPYIVARHPAARLLVVGGESQDIARFHRLLQRSGAGHHVVFAGKQSPGLMPEFMAMGEVLVSPRCSGRNTPLKLFSYMHSGVPIVATDLPTHTQVLDSDTAVLCAPTAHGLATAISEVLERPDAYRKVGTAARERVRQRYSPEAFARKLLEAYAHVAESSRRSSADRPASARERSALATDRVGDRLH
ncbi:MAG: glycosyltransferase family 4 protein [Gemmatimonadaceae bacterium]